MVKEGGDPEHLKEKHSKEVEVVNAELEAEEAQQLNEIVKKLNDEHKDAVKQSQRNLLNEVTTS